MPSREITWLDRPQDMNGSVSPVVGIRPSDTAMCMKAVSPMVVVRPTGYCPNGRPRCARSEPEPAEQREERNDDEHLTNPHSSPIVLKRKSE